MNGVSRIIINQTVADLEAATKEFCQLLSDERIAFLANNSSHLMNKSLHSVAVQLMLKSKHLPRGDVDTALYDSME